MTELRKTLTFVAVALVLTGAAVVTTRDRTALNETFNDQGQLFFPEFKDPLTCTDLEVVDFEPSTATASRFRVMFKDNKWVIPSHYDYPADARDRLSKTAAAVMDLAKDTIRSDRPEDQEAMDVIDPLDTKITTLKGRGKRVTLRDRSEKVLADFIIGNEIKDRSGQRYVRVPGQKRTYGVKVKADLSTRFADWIETNLLKLDASKIRRIEFDNYKVNLEQGMQRGEVFKIERKDSFGPWTMAGLGADQELDSDKLRALTDALSDLKIVGVRTKPAGLTRDLKKSEGITISNSTVASLQSKGFYMTRDGQLLSNQGDVRVFTDEGVVYTLRFGELVFGAGDELTAGIPDDVEKKGDAQSTTSKDKEAKKPAGTTENRYVMVTVDFDPSLIPPPKKEEEKPSAQPGKPLVIPSQPFAPNPNDPKYQAEQKEAKEKADREKADYEKKITDGKKRVQELTDRFAAWYYVTPGESFRSINLDRAALVKPKKAESSAARNAASSPASSSLPPIQP
jgi:hypothetical protein